jgi:hypothetical protein
MRGVIVFAVGASVATAAIVMWGSGAVALRSWATMVTTPRAAVWGAYGDTT